jgi:hypothetical protein
MTRLVLGGAAILGASLATTQVYEENLPLEHPAIQYRHEPADDPVLGSRAAREKTALWTSMPGCRICRASSTGSAVDSQTLVFSKTSVQESLISSHSAGDLFRDDVVAFVPGTTPSSSRPSIPRRRRLLQPRCAEDERPASSAGGVSTATRVRRLSGFPASMSAPSTPARRDVRTFAWARS